MRFRFGHAKVKNFGEEWWEPKGLPKDELEISVYMQQSQTHRLAQQYSGILEVGKEEQWIRNGTPIGTEACEAKEVC